MRRELGHELWVFYLGDGNVGSTSTGTCHNVKRSYEAKESSSNETMFYSVFLSFTDVFCKMISVLGYIQSY